MKSRSACGVTATVFAALTIIGCCLSHIRLREKRRVIHQVQLEEAVENWEGEGGAVIALDEDDEREPARA
jgi:hypothetical protein